MVVLDSRPLLEGRSLLKRLLAAGLPATYCLLNALSYILKEVTKVRLGVLGLSAQGAPHVSACCAVQVPGLPVCFHGQGPAQRVARSSDGCSHILGL